MNNELKAKMYRGVALEAQSQYAALLQDLADELNVWAKFWADNDGLPQFLAFLVKMADVKMDDEDVAYTRLAYVGVVDAFIDRQSPSVQLFIFKSSQWRYFFRGPEGY